MRDCSLYIGEGRFSKSHHVRFVMPSPALTSNVPAPYHECQQTGVAQATVWALPCHVYFNLTAGIERDESQVHGSKHTHSVFASQQCDIILAMFCQAMHCLSLRLTPALAFIDRSLRECCSSKSTGCPTIFLRHSRSCSVSLLSTELACSSLALPKLSAPTRTWP